MKDAKDVRGLLKQLEAGETIDVSLFGHGIRSSKEARKCGDDLYSITHDIDDSMEWFDLAGITEVLRGERSPWDGNSWNPDVSAEMEMPDIEDVTTAGQAQSLAIDWQQWASEQTLSYSELADWQAYFTELANKFDLTDEFKENGII